MLYMTALVIDDNGRLIGFLILDTYSEQIRVFTYEQIRTALLQRIKIENMAVSPDGTLVMAGDPSRYNIVTAGLAVIKGNSLIYTGSVEVNTKEGNKVYKLIGYNGINIKTMYPNELGIIAEFVTISNGKIVKSASGNFFISSLSVDTPVPKYGAQLIEKSSNTKYQIPPRMKSSNYNSGYRNYIEPCGAAKIREDAKSFWSDVRNINKYISNRHGIRLSDRHGKSMHEILRGEIGGRALDIAILELKFGTQTKFLIQSVTEYRQLVVDDILYTRGLVSTLKCEQQLGEHRNNILLLALGQVGLIVIRSKGNKEQGYKIVTQCIPYCRLTDIDTIRGILNKLNYIDEQDVHRIYQKAMNPPIKSHIMDTKQIDEIGVAYRILATPEELKERENQGILAIEKIKMASINEGTFNLHRFYDCDFKTAIVNEASIISAGHNVIQLSATEYALANISPTFGKINKTSDGKFELGTGTNIVALDTIAFLALAIQAKDEEVIKGLRAILGQESYNVINDNLLDIKIKQNKLIVVYSDHRIKYEISIIREKCKEFLRCGLDRIDKANRLRHKLMIVDERIRLDERGMLVDWPDNIDIELPKQVCGIRYTMENKQKIGRFVINGDIDIEVQTGIYIGLIQTTLVFGHDRIGSLIRVINDGRVEKSEYMCHEVEIDCKELTLPELVQSMSLIMRSHPTSAVQLQDKQGNRIKSLRLSLNSFDYNVFWMVKSLSALYSNTNKFSTIKENMEMVGRTMKIRLINQDKLDNNIKSMFLDYCFKSINKIKKSYIEFSKDYIYYMTSLICKDKEEANQLYNEALNRYLNT